MKKSILLIALILGLTSNQLLANTDKKAQAYFFAAEDAYKNKEYSSALSGIKKAEKLLGGGNAVLQSLRVKILHDKGDYELAQQALDKFYTFKANTTLEKEIAPYLLKIDDKLEEQRLAKIQAEKERLARIEKQRLAKIAAEEQRLIELEKQRLEAEKIKNLFKEHTKRYTINDNGTATDNNTGLMWMRCSIGQKWDGTTCTGEASKHTFDDVHDNTYSFAGFDNWRVPSIKELNTLVYCSNGKQIKYKKDGYNEVEHEGGEGCSSDIRGKYLRPTINQAVFPNTPASYFWSASPYASNSDSAWLLYFVSGYDVSGYRNNDYRVRLVRVGQ
jgi:hypothetical protein